MNHKFNGLNSFDNFSEKFECNSSMVGGGGKKTYGCNIVVEIFHL